jgi:mannitol/fructose-specific phosphotransferase system IIA component (Ntr-type)
MDILRKAWEEDSLILDLQARDLGEIFEAALQLIIDRGRLAAEHRERVRAALLEREEQVSTAIGHAVAVPHAYVDCFEDQVVVFVRLASSLNLGAPDGIATRFVFILLGPPGAATRHLDTLTAVARLMSDEQFRYDAAVALNGRDLLSALSRFEARTIPAAAVAAAEITPGLQYSGRLFGGILGDFRRRIGHYRSDFTDGLHPKALSATLFMLFAVLAPTVTFGGLMAAYTGNRIGPFELIVATAICGTIYALFSGQPLTLLGGTGPLLVFTAILYGLCVEFEVPFLPAFAWVGLWTGAFMVVLAVTDAGCLMRYFTRFTNEIFAALITTIFIISAIRKLAQAFENLDEQRHHATAVLTLLLALGTVYVAHSLSRFRRSRFLMSWMREFLADFGPAIALLAMTLFAFQLNDVDLDPLPMPDSLRPTHEVETAVVDPETGLEKTIRIPRKWLIDLGDVPGWVPLAAIVPALLGTVLMFVDQNITVRLVNSRDHKLKKGEAYHWDFGLLGVMTAGLSLFGLPWVVAATVRSLNHVRSLAATEEVIVPGGDAREKIIHVRETRLPALCIHLLMAASLVFLAYLKYIPMAVLYGLFLFMGIVSIRGNQLFERMSLWVMDRNLYPSTHYIRMVPNRRIHAFTLIQFAGLLLLGLVQIAPPEIGILFPLLVVLMVPLRMLMNRHFEASDLAALDAEEEPDEEVTHWAA